MDKTREGGISQQGEAGFSQPDQKPRREKCNGHPSRNNTQAAVRSNKSAALNRIDSKKRKKASKQGQRTHCPSDFFSPPPADMVQVARAGRWRVIGNAAPATKAMLKRGEALQGQSKEGETGGTAKGQNEDRRG